MSYRRKPVPMERHAARQFRLQAAAISLAIVLIAQVCAIGANDGFLAIGGDLLSVMAAGAILLFVDPPMDYWRSAWPTLLLLVVTVLWPNMPASALLRALIPPMSQAYSQWLTPDLAGYGFCRMLGALACLLAGSWIGYRRGGLRLFIALLVFGGVVDLFIGLGLRQYDPLHVWGYDKGIHTYRFTGTMLNANASGCLFGMTTILALGLLQDQLRHRVRHGIRSLLPATLTIAAIATYGGCAITQSRTALALTTAGCLIIGLWHSPSRRKLFQPRSLVVSAVILCAICGAALAIGDTALERFSLLDRDGAERLSIWSHYLQVAQLAPLLGFGPGSFELASMRSLGSPSEALLLWFVNSAHNKPLGLVIEHGWPFLLLVLTAIVVLLLPFYRARKHQSPVSISVLAALCVLAGQSLVDIALDVPALLAYAMALMGLLWGYSLRSGIASRGSGEARIVGGSGRAVPQQPLDP